MPAGLIGQSAWPTILPFEVDLDQVRRAHLRVVQAERVDQVVPVLVRHAQRDVVVDQLGPAEVVEDAVRGGELHAGVPLGGAEAGRADEGGRGVHGGHGGLLCDPAQARFSSPVLPRKIAVRVDRIAGDRRHQGRHLADARDRAGGDNRTMIRYRRRRRRDASPQFLGRAAHRAARRRAAPEPAGVDSGQLPGARVRAPSVAADGASRAARRAAASSSTRRRWLAHCDGRARAASFATSVYAFDTSVRAAFLDAHARLLQRHRPVPARRGPRSASRTRSRSRGLPRRLGRRHDARCRAAAAARTSLRGRRLRRAGRPPGRARRASGAARFDAGGVPHEFVVAGALARLRRRAAARRHAAHLRGADRVLARPRPGRRSSATCSCSTRSRTATAASSTAQHGADRAAARPAATRGELPAPRSRAERRLRRRARPDRPRVLPRLERQAPEAARVRDASTTTRENYTAAALVLRRLHLVLRRPVRCCAPA